MTRPAVHKERGLYDGPILITNSHSVGIVADAATRWMRARDREFSWTAPIVAETYDGSFNDMDDGHVRAGHAFAALDVAIASALPAEGNVGGGAGRSTYEYKGGTGTASRTISHGCGGYTVGVLVQSNYGERRHLRIGGIRMGEALADDLPRFLDPELITPELKAKHHR